MRNVGDSGTKKATTMALKGTRVAPIAMNFQFSCDPKQ